MLFNKGKKKFFPKARQSMLANSNQYNIEKNIECNIAKIKEILGKNDDIVFRNIENSNPHRTRFFLCYVSGLTNIEMVNQHIIKELMQSENSKNYDKRSLPAKTFNTIKNNILSIADLSEHQMMKNIIEEILSGKTAIFIDKCDKVLIVNSYDFESRSIEEPGTQNVVRGPREGFTENIAVNIALVRRKIKNPNLILEKFIIGKKTRTDVFIGYIDGIVNPKIVEEVKKRLNQIQIDSILESGYIEQLIEDNHFSIFSTIGNTEKPDIVAAKLLEGRVAIFCDGTPFVLSVPFLWIENLQNSEDYYSRPVIALVIRILRFIALFVTVCTPALYVAVTLFHYEMIPTVLLITMAASREGIPFPSFVEAILMGIVFEMIKEAGVRMPRNVGQSITVFGALVLGEVAVTAGIVSSPMVIIIAVTGISDFINPSLVSSSLYLRIFLLFLAAGLGLYGILIGFFFILAHLCSLRSFGSPYLAPFAPTIWSELKDTIVRTSLSSIKLMPKSITWKKTPR